jgi:hypothetical protein
LKYLRMLLIQSFTKLKEKTKYVTSQVITILICLNRNLVIFQIDLLNSYLFPDPPTLTLCVWDTRIWHISHAHMHKHYFLTQKRKNRKRSNFCFNASLRKQIFLFSWISSYEIKCFSSSCCVTYSVA